MFLQDVAEILTNGQSKMDSLVRAYAALKVDIHASSTAVPESMRHRIHEVCTAWVAVHGRIVKLQSDIATKPDGDANAFQQGPKSLCKSFC